ncbi:glycoside hydrolase family 3 N-terminal domain-containing protein [Gryllotalpicola reticulitermitis]|uniref:beta-N-acetylhexosaminidase n=1 Tax=Gryllotalpicola reticulitermitis TaxID=1184153 RepID=A0ABV8Q9V9_9MICO
MRPGRLVLLAAAVAVALGGCSSPSATTVHPSAVPNSAPTRATAETRTPTPTFPPSPTPTSTSVSPTQTATVTASPTASPAPGLSLAQCVGQLFMVGSPATTAASATIGDVADLGVGGVFLSGRSTAGAAVTSQVTREFQASDRSTQPLLIATDQEGGEVQVLRGPGFSDIPSAETQASMSPAALASAARAWAAELRAAGVDMDLAPVSDVIVSAQQAAANPPIGQLQREYGYGAASVLPHAEAFESGMRAGGVVPVAKHFPGLGAVTANTDFSAGVTDTTTTAASPSVAVDRSLIADGLPVVMVSSAIYSQLAPGVPAVFAQSVVTTLLRAQLGFGGVIMTDDVSAAQQLAAWSPAERAILAIGAGVDLVLVSAAPEEAPEMIAGVLSTARTTPAFAAQVESACARVVQLKERYLPPR